MQQIAEQQAKQLAQTLAAQQQQQFARQQKVMMETLKANLSKHFPTVNTNITTQDITPTLGQVETSITYTTSVPNVAQTPTSGPRWQPPTVNVVENDTEMTITCSLPQYSLDNIGVTLLDDGNLSLSGAQEVQEIPMVAGQPGTPCNCRRQFKRIVNLPANVQRSDVDANFENDVLRVVVHKPKAVPQQGPRHIEVQ